MDKDSKENMAGGRGVGPTSGALELLALRFQTIETSGMESAMRATASRIKGGMRPVSFEELVSVPAKRLAAE
jgi:hypothetical protein